jgi:Predicted acyltransferases
VDQAAAFYLPWTRAWELLLGTLIALGLFAQPRTPLWRNIAALAGLALILGPAAAYNAATVFPGANALAPCLGAALIIAAGRAGDSWSRGCCHGAPWSSSAGSPIRSISGTGRSSSS